MDWAAPERGVVSETMQGEGQQGEGQHQDQEEMMKPPVFGGSSSSSTKAEGIPHVGTHDRQVSTSDGGSNMLDSVASVKPTGKDATKQAIKEWKKKFNAYKAALEGAQENKGNNSLEAQEMDKLSVGGEANGGNGSTNSTQGSGSAVAGGNTKSKERNHVVDAALSVVKGALLQLFKIPNGHSTLERESNFGRNKGRIQVVVHDAGAEGEDPLKKTNEDLEEKAKDLMLQAGFFQGKLQTLVSDVVDEDKAFQVYQCSRTEAEERYGQAMYESNLPSHVKEVRLAYLQKWAVNLAGPTNKTLRSTGVIGAISIDKITFKKKNLKSKSRADAEGVAIVVNFSVDEQRMNEVMSSLGNSAMEAEYFADEELATVDVAPTVEDILAPNAQEVKKYLGLSTEVDAVLVEEDDHELTEHTVVIPTGEEGGQKVTAYEVQGDKDGNIDYDKIVSEFGCKHVTESVVQRIERLTGKKPHRYLRREIFYAHRDLNLLLDKYEAHQKKQKSLLKQGLKRDTVEYPFYLYTGRGPSSDSLHLGHLVPFIFNKWLQEIFEVPLVIQITDDEKFWAKHDLTWDRTYQLARQNIKDIMALGFEAHNTFIFIDTDYIPFMYPVTSKLAEKVTTGLNKGAMGFTDSTNVGMNWYVNMQAAPSFSDMFPMIFGPGQTDARGEAVQVPCLIPCAIDQDPFFRVTRDVASKLKWAKTSTLYSKFFPGLKGQGGKMSSSDKDSKDATIFIDDTPAEIKRKVFKYAVSGGQQTAELQKLHGADLSKDVSWAWLQYLIEDDHELANIGRDYESGKMQTGQIKQILVDALVEVTSEIQAKRKQITEEMIDEITDHRLDKRATAWAYPFYAPKGGWENAIRPRRIEWEVVPAGYSTVQTSKLKSLQKSSGAEGGENHMDVDDMDCEEEQC
ncbi:unnamed protein product [Amoebophrya sp. A25]|nr:unnamed protein product [Amoebophrya sp. A25]|eukprot:GSA25T00027686001.1